MTARRYSRTDLRDRTGTGRKETASIPSDDGVVVFHRALGRYAARYKNKGWNEHRQPFAMLFQMFSWWYNKFGIS